MLSEGSLKSSFELSQHFLTIEVRNVRDLLEVIMFSLRLSAQLLVTGQIMSHLVFWVFFLMSLESLPWTEIPALGQFVPAPGAYSFNRGSQQKLKILQSKCSLLSVLNLLSHSWWLCCLESKEKLSKQHKSGWYEEQFFYGSFRCTKYSYEHSWYQIIATL